MLDTANPKLQDYLNAEYAGIHRRTAFSKMLETSPVLEELRLRMKIEADEKHKPYPQYKGSWDTWVVGRLLKDWHGKGGTQGLTDDYVLVSRRAEIREARGGFKYQTTFYSMRGGVNCGINVDDVEIL